MPINAEVLRNQFNGKDERSRNLLEIVKAYHRNMEKLIGKDYEKVTVGKFHTTVLHLTSFVKWKYYTFGISLSRLKYEFIIDFEFYLKTEKKSAIIQRPNMSEKISVVQWLFINLGYKIFAT